MPKDVILTPEGLANLKAELDTLTTTRRREVAARIKEAREFGDISENAEYDDAKNEQAMLEARIASLEEKLRSATVIDASDLGTDLVRVGSVVHVKDDGGKSTRYTIVGSAEASPGEAKLSNESPVGKALLGRKRGEEVVIATPRGERTLKITKIDVRPSKEPAAVAEQAEGSAELLAARRRKLESLRAAGIDPFPHEFDDVEPIAAVRAAHAGLAQGEETDRSPPGRRTPGGAPRPGQDGVPRSGRPLRADPAPGPRRRARPEGMDRLLGLDLGDLIGVDGVAFMSRRGELSLRVEAFELLAKSLRPPPEKHHGLTDVETRFRQRELDLIANPEARELFIAPRPGDLGRPARSSTPRGSSRSRRRFCSRCTAAPRRGRSRPTTTRWIASSTCGSRPSCTSSG